MKSRTYTNAHIGDYKTYKANDVYEAMYLAKYPDKAEAIADLSKHSHAVARIQKYRECAAQHSLQKTLKMYKVQIIDLKSKPELLPNYVYIKYSNDKWSPIILVNKKQSKVVGGVGVVDLRSTLNPLSSASRQSTQSNQVRFAQQPLNKNPFKNASSSLAFPLRPQSAMPSSRKSSIPNRPQSATSYSLTDVTSLVSTPRKPATITRAYIDPPSQLVEKIQYIRKRLLSKRVLDIVDNAFKNNKFIELQMVFNKTLYNAFVKEVDGLTKSYDNFGYDLYENMLPCYELIDTIKNLNRVYKRLTLKKGGKKKKFMKGGNEDEYEDDNNEDIVSEIAELESMMGDDEIPTISLIDGTVFESDDDEDDDYNPSPEETYGLFESDMETYQFIQENEAEFIEIGRREKRRKYFKYITYFTAFIFVLVSYYVQKMRYTDYSSIYISNQADVKTPFSIETVVSKSIDPATQVLSLDTPSNPSFLQRQYLSGTTINNLQINLDINTPPNNEVNSFKDYVNQFSDYAPIQASVPPSCTLISSPDNLSFRQQLFAHKENLMEYYIELINFMMSSKQQSDVLGLTSSIDETIMNAFKTEKNIPLNYVQIVENAILPQVIKNFNEFGNKLNTVSNVRSLFTTLKNLDTYASTSTRFKERMDTFEQTLIEHALRFQNGMSFQDMSGCATGNKNTIQIGLSRYTQGLLYDIRMNYQTIAKRTLRLYEDFIPVVERIVELYSAILQNGNAKLKETEFSRVVDQIKSNTELQERIPQLQTIQDILTDTSKAQFYRLNTAIDIIASMNPRFNKVIADMKTNMQYNNFISSITGGIVNVEKTTVNQLFASFKEFAVDAKDDVKSRVGPNFFNALADVSNMMVDALNKNVLTETDKRTINYVASSKIASFVYEIFSTSEIGTLFEEIPGYKTIRNIADLVIDQTLKDSSDEVIRMGAAAMRLINAEIINRQTKLNSKTSIINSSDMFTMIGTYAKSYMFDKDMPMMKKLLEVADSVSQDYIRIHKEIQQRELAIILLHLQNDILSDNMNGPSYTDISLLGDTDFLKSYYNDKKMYINKIAQKLLNIMGLTFIEKNSVFNTNAIKSGGGVRRKSKGKIISKKRAVVKK